jgi:hypothetical protein
MSMLEAAVHSVASQRMGLNIAVTGNPLNLIAGFHGTTQPGFFLDKTEAD